VKKIAVQAALCGIVLIAFLAILVACSKKEEPTATAPPTASVGATDTTGSAGVPVYCTDTANTAPCALMPHNVPTSNGYSTVNMDPTVQTQFDNFSWQSFVAINWPANPDGTPNTGASLGSSPTVFDYYKQANDVFLADGSQPDSNYPTKNFPPPPVACTNVNKLTAGAVPPRIVNMSAKEDSNTNFTDSFNEAAVNVPLIDSNGNFVVYDVAMNKDEFEYIFGKGYYNSNNQPAATVTDTALVIDFPPGEIGGAEGSIEVKTAWKILGANDDASTYITRMMQMYVPAQDFCTPPLKTGLIGMHIIHKTAQSNAWVWSTFEHVNNVPESSTPLPADAKAAAGQCAPPSGTQPLMSLYNPACANADGSPCALNQPPTKSGQPIVWAKQQPYAAQYLTNGKYGTQVVRCAAIYPTTAQLTQQWQQKLPKPFSNYMLIGSQWFAASDFPPTTKGTTPNPVTTLAGALTYINPDFPPNAVAAPPYLQNTAAETYLQNGTTMQGFHMGSCLHCHSGATGAQCEPANFSFLLGRAKPKQKCQDAGAAQVRAALAR
jgi:hypothetical protein